ncbi:NCS2 family permease [Candidatus Mycoplasma mahonii]|uniref:NCS2 family permease n=1 Tax=Candidatus Mycoplasma mahonii TaxID=3004105 RepID=UPI0026EDCF8E|nr:NCS2 family permease [Candidatus Mycoplasma mahonii]WKX02441.1 NCS2 family permease [Candidatus Mycoplasma mahonii]
MLSSITDNISKFFKFKDRSATFKKEIVGGITTFLAMSYILAVNPAILSNANGARDYTGVFFLGTVLSAFIGTLAMGLFANVPIALAPGMGVNAFLAYTVAGNILGMQIEGALIATLVSGILYAIIAITPARKYIAKILPRNMKLGIGAMIGMFLAYIGLVDSGIIVSGASPFGNAFNFGEGAFDGSRAMESGALGISTATKLGNLKDPFVIVALVVMALVFVLHFAKIKGAAIIAMMTGIVLLAILKVSGVTDASLAFKLNNYNSFSKFGQLSRGMWNSFGSSFSNGKIYIAIFVFLYIDFFDTTGTLFAVEQQAGLEKDGKWLKKANIVDAGSTIVGSLMLTSTTTSYIESTAGISQGARTGFASVISSLGFILAIALWPIMTPILPINHIQEGVASQSGTIMPVTGPILILVGSIMIGQLKSFDWNKTLEIPILFVTIAFGMLSYSISTGIAAGVVMFYLIDLSGLLITTIKMKRGLPSVLHNSSQKEFWDRIKNPIMIAMFALAVVYFATMPLYAY